MLSKLICLPILVPLLAGGTDNDTARPVQGGVAIYERFDFGGDSRVLVADVTDLAELQGPCGIGDGSWSDCISSIQLPSGWTATLYELDRFEGDSLNVTSSISNLENFPGCAVDWNNCARSIRVRRLIHHDSAGSSEVHPHDITDEAGLFIYSPDGLNALRIFGSFRMLAVLDNRQNFHAYDLVPPSIPTGEDDFRNLNSVWTPHMSRIGIDALIGERTQGSLFSSAVLIRLETDWKGDTEKFRIRHFFLRSKHWLIGQSWSTLNNLTFLPLTVDGRMAGAALGMRTPQIRYYSSQRHWDYQVSLEYRKTTMLKPDSLNAISQVVVPDLAGRAGYKTDRSEVAIAAILRPNRVQFPDDENRVQQLLGYGGVVGFSYRLNDRNRLKLSVSGGTGMGTYMADYAWSDIDVAYDPFAAQFDNVDVYGAFVALEHDWTEELSSTIGGSYLGTEEKDYFQDLTYVGGYKVLVNLFFRPAPFDQKVVLGGEAEYATRKNMNGSQSSTKRMGVLMYYNF